ncbi:MULTISPECIES: GNAT family N-acetyltransferase [Streptomyces]|uniref:GNAT family N-acetyltransferase n=1 Tax=Streptomyces TaxID=1883 RepID=UPI002DDA7C82|nr:MULTISPECIES: GNAT family N-acetyltransferase [unclassified Streptomyces]WSD96184.1 GNAT family N-acetyltransferase [Streptomyces sp. NBC_01474]
MGVAIRRATEGDRADLVRLLDEAFMDDPVSGWVFPGLEHRRRRHAGLMAAFIDISLSEGYVDITEDGAAAALWLSVPAGPRGTGGADEGDDGPAQLRAAVDPDNERVEEIGRLTSGAHPRDRGAHEYLWMIAVDPARQGRGLGTALMEPVLDRCDREGVASYLEASSDRSRVLYERLGFACTGSGIALPDGPTMWPMWRDPQVS